MNNNVRSTEQKFYRSKISAAHEKNSQSKKTGKTRNNVTMTTITTQYMETIGTHVMHCTRYHKQNIKNSILRRFFFSFEFRVQIIVYEWHAFLSLEIKRITQ